MKVKHILFVWAWLMPLLLSAQDGSIEIRVLSYFNPRTDYNQTTFKLSYSFDKINYTSAPGNLACYSVNFPKNAWEGINLTSTQKTFRIWNGATTPNPLPTIFYIKLEAWGETQGYSCEHNFNDGTIGRTIWTVNLAGGNDPNKSIRPGVWKNVWYAERNPGYPEDSDIEGAAKREPLDYFNGGKFYDVEFEVRYVLDNPGFNSTVRVSGNVASICEGEIFAQKLQSNLNQQIPSTKGVDVRWMYRLERKYKERVWTGTYEPVPTQTFSCGWRTEIQEVNCRFETICTDPLDLNSCYQERVCDYIDVQVPDCVNPCQDTDSDLIILIDGNGNYVIDGNGNPIVECRKRIYTYNIVSNYVYGTIPVGMGYTGLLDSDGGPQNTKINFNDINPYDLPNVRSTLQAQYNDLNTLVKSKLSVWAQANYPTGSPSYNFATTNSIELGELNYPPKPVFLVPDNNILVFTETEKEVSNPYIKISNVLCKDGNQGKIEITRVDGFGKYYYSLRKQGGSPLPNQYSLSPLSASSPVVFSNLTSGVYELAIENYDVVLASGTNPSFSTNGCFGVFSFTIGEPARLEVTGINSPLKIAGNVHVSCFNGSDGVIEVEAAGGVANYYFKLFKKDGLGNWNHQVRATDNIAQNKNFSFTGLSAGEYRVEIQDIFKASGCSVTSPSVVLTEPTALTSSLSGHQLYQDAISGSFYDIKNFGGSQNISVLPQGGSPNYTVTIGANTQNVVANSAAGFTLIAGDYSYLTKDMNACENNGNFTLHQPLDITLNQNVITPVSCFGGNDGRIEVTAQGGIRSSNHYAYKLLKSGDINFEINLSGNASSAAVSFTNLEAGTYTLEVVDRYLTKKVFSNLVVSQPSLISISNRANHRAYVSCFGSNDGIISLQITGGTPPYSYEYQLNGGAWSTLTSTSAIIEMTGLSTGNYSFRLKDSKNCFNREVGGFVTKDITIEAPSSTLQIIAIPIDVSCRGGNDGKVFLSARGGWLSQGSPVFLDGSGNIVSNSVFNLPSGTYTFQVRDPRGCQVSTNVTVGEPLELIANNIQANPTLCFGEATGSVSISIQGGTSPYEVSLDGAGAIPYVSGQTITGLSAGSHTVQVIDNNGCQKSYNFEIIQPSEILVTTSAQLAATCGAANGSVTVSVNGGVGNYQYQWFNSSGGSVGENSPTLSNAIAGIYTVHVRDANSCLRTQSVIVPSEDGPQGTVSVLQNVSCFNGNDGSASISIIGGQAPYTVQWANGQTGLTSTGLLAGVQIVQITDATGCLQPVSFTITQPLAVSYQAVFTSPTCFEGNDGKIEVFGQGGTAPYQYLWLDNNSANPLRENLTAGVYGLRITDSKNCQYTTQLTLSQPSAIRPLFQESNFVICPGQALTLDAGNAGSTYEWTGSDNFTASTQKATITKAGNYQIRITNPQGCVGTQIFSVTISNDALKAEFLAATEITEGDTLVVIDVTNPAPSEVVWSYDVSNSAILRIDDQSVPYYAYFTFSEAGTYVMTMQVKLYGCTSSMQKTITVLPRTGKIRQEGLGYQGEGEISTLLVYPNPSTGVFSTKVELVKEAPIEVFLYGLQNRESYFKRSLSGAKQYEIEVDLPQLPAGNYVLVVKTPHMTKTQSIIIYR